MLHPRRPGPRRDRHDEEGGEEEEEDLRRLVDAEPEDDQRDQRQRRDRPHELHDRVENPARHRRQPHGEAERYADQRAEKTPVSTRKTLIQTCSQSGMLRKPCVASCTSRFQVASIGGQKNGSIQPKAEAAHQSPNSSATVSSDQKRPELTALGIAEPHRLLPGEGIVGQPEPDREPCPASLAIAQPSPPMISSSISQIIDRISSRAPHELAPRP